MFDFKQHVKEITLNKRGRRPAERRVIRGIIHKKCPICDQWIPESEFRRNRQSQDAKQGYCARCQLLYQTWRRAVCKHYKVNRLKDIEGFVQPERGQEMRRYVGDIIKYGGPKDEL